MAAILALLASSCGDDGSSPTSPTNNAVNIAGTWTGTQDTISVTSGNHCVHQLMQNLAAQNRFSESLGFRIVQFEDLVTVTPSVASRNGGSYEGRVTGSDFSARFKGDTGALGQPTFCNNTDFVLVEKGGALTGHISAGSLSGTGTRDFYITDKNLNALATVTATYQFSVRK